MRKIFPSINKLLWLIPCWFLLANLGYSQGVTRGTDFWFSFLRNIYQSGPVGMRVYVSSPAGATGTVSIPGCAFSQNYTCPPGGTIFVQMPACAEPTGSGVIENKGVHVTASTPSGCYAVNAADATTDGSIILPVTTLGYDYLVTTWTASYASYPTEFVVASPFNGVQVEITPSAATVNGWPAGVPQIVTLNQGEVMQVRSPGELTGSRVRVLTNNCNVNPVAVFGGNECTNVAMGACDHLYEITIPIAALGTSHVYVPNQPGLDTDILRILGTQNNTIVSVDGVPRPPINAGQYIDIDSNTLPGTANMITSDKPIAVNQFAKGYGAPGRGSKGDPMMMAIPPESMSVTDVTLSTIGILPPADHHINITTLTANTGSITVTPAPISCEPWTPVPGNPTFSSRRCEVNVGATTVSSSGGPFIFYMYGWGSSDSYGYAGAGLVLPRPLDVIYSDSVCSNISESFTAVFNNNNNPNTNITWDWGDGSPTEVGPPPTHTTRTHTYATCGKFRITVTYTSVNNAQCTILKDVYVWATPTLTITAPPGLCTGQTGVVTFDVTGTCNGQRPMDIQNNLNPNTVPSRIYYKIDNVVQPPLTAFGDGPINFNIGPMMAPITITVDSVVNEYTPWTGSRCASIPVNNTVTVPVNPPPIVSVTPPLSVCRSRSATLTASGGNTYLWSGGENTPSITVTPLVTTSYTVTVTTGPGCSNTATTTVTVLTDATITASPANSTICIGRSATVTAAGGVSYVWAPGGGNTASITVNPLTTTIYTVTGTNIDGCTGTASVTVTVNPLPIISIAPATRTVCFDDPPTSFTASGGVTYLWNPGNMTGATITVDPATTTTYTVTGTDANGCTNTATATLTVTPNPPAPTMSVITSPVCPGQLSTTYSVTNVPGTTYNWIVPPVATLVTGQGTNAITVNWKDQNNIEPAPGTYSFSVTATAQNCVSTPTTFSVVVNPPPPVQPGPITGPTPVCQNQSAVYAISAVPDATTYTWSGIPGGASITSGQGTTSITVDWGSAAPGVYLINVTAGNSCGTSAPQFMVVTVITVPPTPGAITGPAIHCVGTSGSYVVAPVAGATSYTWANSCGWSGTSTTNTIDYVAQDNGPCIISVTANNQCGSSPLSTITVTPLNVPTQPSTVNGRNIVCQGQMETYSVISVPGVTYTWAGLPVGANVISGQGTESVTIDWGTTAAGNYTLTVTPSNFCGNGTVRTFRVQVMTVPTQPSPISGNINLCENSSSIYSVTWVAGVTYAWSVSPAGPLLGQNGNSVEVSWNQPGTYVLTVIPSNTCGAGPAQTLTVTIADRPTPDAGVNATPCGPTTILMGSPSGGVWACEYCPGGATVQSVGIFGLVSGLAPDAATVFKYEITDPICGVVTDYVLVRNDLAVPGTVTGSATVCEGATGVLSLTGQTPTATIVRWERSNDNFVSNIVPIQNTVPSYTYSNLTETSQFRAVVILSGTCPEVHSFHATIVVVPKIIAQATPSLQIVCTGDAVVSGTVPMSGTGMWSFISGPSSAVIVTNNGMGIISGMTAEGDYTFRWTITNSPCPVNYTDVVVRRKPAVSVANAGPNQKVCGSTATLVGNAPMSGVGTWHYVGGPSAAFVTTAGVQGIVTNMDLPGDYEFEWEILEPNCNQRSTSRMIVTRMEEPTAAVAGAHQDICGSTTTLSGNVPLIGTGTWSFVSGPVFPTISQSGNLATVINMDVEGEYIFRYTITNAPCDASFSEVRVTKIGDVSQAQVINTNLTACSNQLTLQAVRPQSGTGTWDFISGPVNAVIFTNGINGVIDGMTVEGDYVFRWTVGNPLCGTSSVNVTVTRHLEIFPPAFAGNNQQFCDRPTALVQGSAPPPLGRGVWAFVSGPMVPSFNQFGNFASVVNMMDPGNYVFSWTVENGPCPPSVSYITLTRVAPPTPAVAGPSGEICGNSVTVTGNRPLQGTGAWSLVSSAGGSPNLNGQGEVATLSNITVPGSYVIRWTISNDPCTPSMADVTIMVNPQSIPGNLNSNITNVCAGTNAGTLTLSNYEGTIVRWESSTDDFNSFNPISNTTNTLTFNNLTQTTSYRVIVKQGTCPEVQSNVMKITVNPQPIAANAGSNQVICGNSITLNGNDPKGSTGTWTFVSGNGIPNILQSGRMAIISDMTVSGDYVFRYEISNACGSTFDDVLVTVSSGSVGGTLSSNATVCRGSNGSLSLAGQNGNIVRWEMSTNNGQTWNPISNTTNTYNYTNATMTTRYRVVVKDGLCPAANSNSVTIAVVTPVVANAGPNQTICSMSTVLNGNPAAPGVGTWSQVSGNPVTMSQSGSRLNVSGMTSGGVYVFKWSIDFGGVCPVSESQVTVTVGEGSLGGEVTTSQTICSGSNVTLNLGNYQGNIVRWERSTNNWNTVLTIINTTNALTINNLTQTTRYRAVVRGGNCAPATSLEAVVTVRQAPPVANAGADQVICGNTTTVSGNNPMIGTPVWRIVSGPGNPTLNQSGQNAVVNGLMPGVTTLEYTIENPPCTATPDLMTITVNEGVNAGFLTGAVNLCDGGGGVSGTLNLINQTGTIVRWEMSTDGFVTVQPIVNTLASYNYANLTQNTSFRVVVSSGSCGTAVSNPAVVTVVRGGYIADGGMNQTICGNSATLTGNIPNGLVGTWQLMMAQPNTQPVLTQNNGVLSVSGMTVPGDYVFRYTLENAPCAPSTADVMVTVTSGTVAGTLATNPNAVCSGNNTGVVTLNGNIGNVVHWESSTDGWLTVTTIPNLLTSYTYTNLMLPTSYRVVVRSGNCEPMVSNPVTVNVDLPSMGGIVNANQTVCTGNNSGNLNLTGYRGTIVRWESSTDNITWTTIPNTSPVQPFLNLTQTIIYRAVVQSGVCATENSASVTITVTGSSVGGALAGSSTVCSGNNTGSLTLSGQVGAIVRWESSTDANFGQNVTTINNQMNVFTYNNLTQTTYYRVLVGSGNCLPALSSVASVMVNAPSAGGSVSMDMTVCSGTNTGTLNLTGQVGNVANWESSLDGITWTMVVNNTNNLTFNNLSQTTWFRAVVVNGNCASAVSQSAKVTVINQSAGGIVSGDATVCPGGNSGNLTLNGQVGTVVRWESSFDCGGFTNPVTLNNQSNVLIYNSLTQTTCYRAVVANGNCGSAVSSVGKIEVLGQTNTGMISGNIGSCAGQASGVMLLSGHNGNVVRWEMSVTGPNGPWTAIPNSNTVTMAYNNLNQTTWYRVVIQQSNCAPVSGVSVEVSVTPPSVGGQLSGGNITVCGGSSGTLNLSGMVGTITRWEMSVNNGPFMSIGNAGNSSYTYNNITATTKFRVVVTSGVCAPAFSNETTVTVSPPLSVSAVSVTGCQGQGSITATAMGGNGGYIYSIIPAVAPNNNNGIFNNIASGSYTINVMDNRGCSASTSVNVSPVATPTSITQITNITTSSALVTWASVPPGAGVLYNLRYRIQGDANWTLITNLTGTTRFLNGLQNNTTYEIEVQYVCPNNGPISGFSTGVLHEFTTLPQGTGDCANSQPNNVPVPGGIYVHNISPTNAQVTWNPVLNAAGYIIAYGRQGDNPNAWAQFVVCNPTTTFLMTNLSPNQNYLVRIRTNCSNCTTALNNNDLRSTWSAQFAYTTPSNREGLISNSINTDLVVYPNPNRGNFEISMNSIESGMISVRMLDVTGREVLNRSVQLTEGENHIPVDLTGMGSGVYLLQVIKDGQTRTVKVVVE